MQQHNPSIYDVAIIGGGLAGLCLSIQLSRSGYKVILFEKESYPFHKVCGEYISLESWNFLEDLGVPLSDWNLPLIHKVKISSPNGIVLRKNLPVGGFGVSRYTLDACLAHISRQAGTHIIEQTKVDNIWHVEGFVYVSHGNDMYKAKLACGTYGKRSNLDVKLKRPFISDKKKGLNNYIAVKYHLKYNIAENEIALHNFEQGYAGISKVENNTCCLCYLTTANNLKKSGNSIAVMEKNILSKNKFLKEIFENAEFVYNSPLTISQISFADKTQTDHHMLMAGDAAGLIAPLCGNGMSMAIHSSKLAFEQLNNFLQGIVNRSEMEKRYKKSWKKTFSGRLATGKWMQRFFGNSITTDVFIAFMKAFPRLANQLIKKTHGKSF